MSRKQTVERQAGIVNNNRRLQDVKRFGTGSMSYSALQDGMKEFRHASFTGFIAYATVWGIDYVLSDPLTPASHRLQATTLFLQGRRRTVFCQVSYDYAMLLQRLNCSVNGLGVEHIVGLKEFKVTWKKRKCLKSYLSKLNNQNYFVFEYESDPDKVAAINVQWLKAKKGSKELAFMARPFTGPGETDVRYFYLLKDAEIVGFCSFDPIYSDDQDGTIVSYALQHLRVAEKAPLGSQDFLILNALFQFKVEGFEKISLGLSPLYQRDNGPFRHSKFADRVFGFMFQNNCFYNYRTIGEHKDHYKAQKRQTYVAAQKNFTPANLCGLLKINNLI